MKITALSKFAHDYKFYAEGKTYDVPPALGHYFVGNGWAENATKEARDGKLSEAEDMDTRSDEEKERAKAAETPRPATDNADLDVQDGQIGSSTNL